MADVSFFDPKKESEVKRRRLIAQQLMQQSEQTPNEVVSGIVVKKSPLEGLAKALGSGVAGYQAGQADKIQTEDTLQKQKILAEAIGQYGQDPQAAAQMLMQSPATSDMGMQMYMSDIKRKQDLELAQAGYARDDMEWEREANLKRELKGMGAGGAFEIDQETGQMVYSPPSNQGNYDPSPLAGKLGVPAAPLDTRGLSGKDSSMYAKQTRLAAEKKLNDPDFTLSAKQARENQQLAGEFEGLMKNQETGGIYAVPGIGTLAGWFDPEIRRMKSIQDDLTPQQREPGSGSTSNFDAEMFQNALFGPNKPTETNKAIIAANKLRAQDTLEYQSFVSDFLSANGHINGADAAWQKYLDENPIFNPEKPEMPEINPKRKTYQEFFGVQKPGNSQPTQAQSTMTAAQYRAKATAAGKDPARIEAFIKAKGLQ